MTKPQFDRAKNSPDKGVLVHLVCNEADQAFYSEEPDQLSAAHCTVLSVETFFAGVCDGGFATWFDLDYGHLAHRSPEALRQVGLPEYAALAEEALRCHCEKGVPELASAWTEQLHQIRSRHESEDCSQLYIQLEEHFFARFQAAPGEFRERLFAYIVEHEADFTAGS